MIILDNIKAIDLCPPFIRIKQRCEQSKKRGFACAIGTDKTKQCASFNLERDVVESLYLAETF